MESEAGSIRAQVGRARVPIGGATVVHAGLPREENPFEPGSAAHARWDRVYVRTARRDCDAPNDGDAANGHVAIAEEIGSACRASNCTLQPDSVRAYVEAGIAPATRRA